MVHTSTHCAPPYTHCTCRTPAVLHMHTLCHTLPFHHLTHTYIPTTPHPMHATHTTHTPPHTHTAPLKKKRTVKRAARFAPTPPPPHTHTLFCLHTTPPPPLFAFTRGTCLYARGADMVFGTYLLWFFPTAALPRVSFSPLYRQVNGELFSPDRLLPVLPLVLVYT